MVYSPFGKKNINEVTADDLAMLVDNGVAEGYTVEFKAEPVNNEKLAHSIASFANTIGGWYIIGVKTDKKNIASEIIGCELQEKDYLSTIRDVAISRIDPMPVIESKIIDIGNKKSVVIVYVPNNQITPFITSDGRIYRRKADSSSPDFEKDRYSVDRLVDKGRERQKEFVRFMNRHKDEVPQDLLAVEIFLAPEPMSDELTHYDDLMTKEGIDGILTRINSQIQVPIGTTQISTTIPFHSVTFYEFSVILKQTPPIDPMALSTEVELTMDGIARIRLPLQPLGTIKSIDVDQFSSSTTRESLTTIRRNLQLCYSAQSLEKFMLYDIGPTLIMSMFLMQFYTNWAKADLWSRMIRVNWRIITTHKKQTRPVVFCDSDTWGNHVIQYGLPIVPRREYTVDRPTGTVCHLDDEDELWLQCLPVLSWLIGLGSGSIPGIFSDVMIANTKHEGNP